MSALRENAIGTIEYALGDIASHLRAHIVANGVDRVNVTKVQAVADVLTVLTAVLRALNGDDRPKPERKDPRG